MDEAGDAGEVRAEGGCRRCKRLGVEVTAVLAGWARGSSSSSGKGGWRGSCCRDRHRRDSWGSSGKAGIEKKIKDKIRRTC